MGLDKAQKKVPKISVIIPIYNVEKYIEQCVRSLLEQTMDDVEFIFIDDCTPDSSMTILKEVLKQYPNRNDNVVICKNIKNSGQSKTRRKGIEMAQGDYVIHCDSDDWVEKDWLESLYRMAISNNADIVWSGFDSIHTDGTRQYFPNKALNNIEDFLIKLEIGKKWGSLCLHLVKRQIVQSEKIVWPDWNYCEDLALIFQYAALSNRVSFINRSLYKYRHNLESITSQRNRDGIIRNVDGEIMASLQGMETCRSLGLSREHLSNLRSRIFIAKTRLMMAAKDNNDFCRLWHKCRDGLRLSDIWNSSLALRDKLFNSLIYFNLYPLIKSIRRPNGK